MIALLLTLHFIADFLLQSREMGKKKSEEFIWLFRHLMVQFFIFAVILMFIVSPINAILFATANAVIHGIIDWNIWRGYKYTVKIWMQNNPDHQATKHYLKTGEFKFWEDHVFFTTIGLDQLLHGLTLVLLAGVLL